ncbi:hypothetical protein RHSIM_RhsimUnG0078500 [Rhododendron simsii]|uniref:Protein kinase domain-containing protein n=1 Tax=Rhododendron simsii TaxID=118357 RepID=A0A834FY65_RHOSS|nr:hypothetical protein RHSIM_RhsimUnG0078500 [Rhododendron simsii]
MAEIFSPIGKIKLLTDSVLCRHPNMVKLNGYCSENGRFGVVYDLKPVDTVHNLVLQDDFKWLARIKVALEFAFLVECLHGEELLLRNTDAAHLIVDEVSLGAYFYLFWTLLRMFKPKNYLACRLSVQDYWTSVCLLEEFLEEFLHVNANGDVLAILIHVSSNQVYLQISYFNNQA